MWKFVFKYLHIYMFTIGTMMQELLFSSMVQWSSSCRLA